MRMTNQVLTSVSLIVALALANECKATDNLDVGVPGGCDQVVDREGYALGYCEKHEQAAWVQYHFTAAENQTRNASRSENFREDPAIKTGAAVLADYRGSGYDRGHLAPAADMKFSSRAMSESFLLSNMSPQNRCFNAGVWNDVEKFVRYTVNIEESLYVVTGPILPTEAHPYEAKAIGPSKVTVPRAFYKVIYDATPPQKMIAFLVPNEPSDKPLASFVVSVDRIEEMTGLDFFSKVQGADALEKSSNVHEWRKLASWRRENTGRQRAARNAPARQRGIVAAPAANPAPTSAVGVADSYFSGVREEYRAGGAMPVSSRKAAPVCDKWPETGWWLNTNSMKRHNKGCPNYRKTRGYPCRKDEGSPCGICGG